MNIKDGTGWKYKLHKYLFLTESQCDLQYSPRKTIHLDIYFISGLKKRLGEDFNSGKLLNLRGYTVKYGPLNKPIIAYSLTEM